MIARGGAIEGQAVLEAALDAYRTAFGQRLRAAYALGSLAHGGFSAAVSDVDLAVIVEDPVAPDDAETIQQIAEAARARGSELARRLSVFWGTAATLRGDAEGGRFPPLDRLDLIENGRLLAGADLRGELPRPGRLELLESGAQFALDLLAQPGRGSGGSAAAPGPVGSPGEDATADICNPERLLSGGIRRVTKLVLFPVRFMFTAETGKVATNHDAVAWYVARDDVPACELVSSALAWRDAAPAEDAAPLALLEDLAGLYLYYIADHATRLAAAGRPELANAFSRWQSRLASEATVARAAREASETPPN